MREVREVREVKVRGQVRVSPGQVMDHVKGQVRGQVRVR